MLAEELRARLPQGVEVHAAGDNLLIYRTEIVRPILDADPAFYRPTGEDDLAAIAGVSAAGQNGELLGYGARNWAVPHGVRVLLSNPEGLRYMFFVSNPELAAQFARERAADIEDYTGLPVNIEITYR